MPYLLVVPADQGTCMEQALRDETGMALPQKDKVA
jgi:hypothetical protein